MVTRRTEIADVGEEHSSRAQDGYLEVKQAIIVYEASAEIHCMNSVSLEYSEPIFG